MAERKGQKWSTEEDTQLFEELCEDFSLEEIAQKHGRTLYAIKLRCIDQAIKAMKEGGYSEDDVCSMFKVTKENLTKMEPKDVTKNSKKLVVKEDQKEILKQIMLNLQEINKNIQLLLSKIE